MAPLNLANKLTVARIFMIPVLVLFMCLDNFWTRIFALAIFVIAALTDAFDGVIARRQKTITTLGIFLDPLADKLLISAALISFVGMKELNVPAWMVIIIISREFVITGLRSLAASRNVIIAASKQGKFKTTSQITAIISIMLILIANAALRHRGLDPETMIAVGPNPALGWALHHLPFWLMFVATFFTVTSGISYLVKHKELFRE